MALKCAKNDFKHSMVHRDRRNENIFGCFLVRFWGPAFLKNKQRELLQICSDRDETLSGVLKRAKNAIYRYPHL